MKRGKIILLVVLLLLMAALLAFAYYKRSAKNDSLGALTFGRPDEGVWILRLQKALNAKGYGLAEDGIFGTATERAVVEYWGKKTVTAAQIEELEGKILQYARWESENKMRNGKFDFSQFLVS